MSFAVVSCIGSNRQNWNDVIKFGVIEEEGPLDLFCTAEAFAYIIQISETTPRFDAGLSNKLYNGFGDALRIYAEVSDQVRYNYLEFLVNTTIAIPYVRDNFDIPDGLIQSWIIDEFSEDMDSVDDITLLYYLRILSPSNYEDYVSKMDNSCWEAMESRLDELRRDMVECWDFTKGMKCLQFADTAFHLAVVCADRIEITDEGLKVFYDEKQSDNGNKNIPPLPLVRKF